MAINGYVRYAAMEIVSEKRESFRENQKIMGLTHWNYMIGQVCFSSIVCLILGMFYFSITYLTDVYKSIPFAEAFTLYILFILAIVCQLYFFTSFFSNQKLASDVLTAVNLFFSFSYLFIYFSDIKSNEYYMILLSLFPQSALTLSFMSEGWLYTEQI